MTWTGTCRSRGFAVLAVGITVLLVGAGIGTVIALQGTGVPLLLGWVLAVVGVVVGIAGWLLSSLEVRVGPERFTVRFGPFGWPRRDIRLVDVTDASAILVEPREWGGWGYRWIPWARASAAVIRRGPGIVLTLTDGRRFAVTVNDAVSGAKATSANLDALPR